MKKCFMLAVLVFVMVAAGEVWEIRAASAAPATPAKRIELRMIMPDEPYWSGPPTVFSPFSAMGAPIAYNVMEPLVEVGKKGEAVPKLATKWEHSKDLTKWRFYLRKRVKFHNGADFTARDVVEFAKWNIELGKASLLDKYMPLKEAVAIDDYTVDLIFRSPSPLQLIQGRVFMIPPVAISRDNREMFKTRAIGTGPYRFVEWKKGQDIKLTKFEGYWGPKPQIDDVKIVFRGEEAVRLAALQAGEADWVAALSTDSASSAPKVAHMASPETVIIRFDEYILKELGGESILADKRLRLAVEYAIDRKALIKLYEGFATPSLGQMASPGDFGFNPHLKSRPYDLEKARALVREAGAVGKTLTFVGSAGKWTKDREVAEAIAYMIEQTGLKVKLMLMPIAETSKYKNVTGSDRPYMADMVMWPSDTPFEVESRYPEFFVQGERRVATTDLEATRVYNEALAETDFAKRAEKVGKAWAYAYEQAHYVPIFKLEDIWGLAKNLGWDLTLAGRAFIADMRFTD